MYSPLPPHKKRCSSKFQAPVSYIIGIDRRYERVELPTDDIVLCDLDQNSIMFSATPMQLPWTARQKLMNLLSSAVSMHRNRGVQFGVPGYIQESYPKNCFTVDRHVLSAKRRSPEYRKFVGAHSLSFRGIINADSPVVPPVFNGFQHCIKEEESDMREFLYGYRGVDPVMATTPRQSYSNGCALRDINANLRNPSHRRSGIWRGPFDCAQDNVASLLDDFLFLWGVELMH